MAKAKKKSPAGPSIGVGHPDWPSMNPGMKPLEPRKNPPKNEAPPKPKGPSKKR